MISHTVPDATLIDWLFEAMNYDTFLEECSLYKKELIYYRALEYQSDMYNRYLKGYSVKTYEELKVYSEQFKKMENETRSKDAGDLIKKLQPIVGYEILKNRSNQNNLHSLEILSTANDERKNQFNSMPLNEVSKWFMQLAENNSVNGKPFLTAEQVEKFISRAFCGNDTIPALTFNIGNGERTSITKLFYLFFNRCTNDYAIEPTKQCKEKYVRLLTDNFTNYNYQTVFDTFNNSSNAPKEWGTTVF